MSSTRKSVKFSWLILCGLLVFAHRVGSEHVSAPLSNHGELLPLPPAPDFSPEKLLIGEKLFNDPILSGNKSMSCADCHDLPRGGDDHQQFSRNTLNKLRAVNTPTVFNVNHSFKILLSGGVDSLNHLYRFNLFGSKVMNNTWPVIINRLKSSPNYPSLFAAAYTDGINQDNIVDAMLVFQASLVTPESPFDRYLRGDETAISAQEKHGYSLFRSYGCIACHQGKHVGGNLYQKFGLFEDYYASNGISPVPTDLGLFNISQRERDKFYFRVPSLRNVAVTGPYLHDGSIEELDDVIRIMGKYQLGRNIVSQERKDIAAFLNSLTGFYKGRPLEN